MVKTVTTPCVNHDELRPIGGGRKEMHGDRIEFTEERIACVDRRRLLRNSENPACGVGGNFDMRGTELRSRTER